MKEVSKVCQGCFYGVSGNFKEVSRKFKECLKKVSRKFLGSFKEDGRVFRWSFKWVNVQKKFE